LIIHGRQDILAPVKAIRRLHSKLKRAGVPVVMHLFPQTDHAFDLILPKISPSAHTAIFDVERFLAMMVIKPGFSADKTKDIKSKVEVSRVNENLQIQV
jgi:acetyl esterase/lipase